MSVLGIGRGVGGLVCSGKFAGALRRRVVVEPTACKQVRSQATMDELRAVVEESGMSSEPTETNHRTDPTNALGNKPSVIDAVRAFGVMLGPSLVLVFGAKCRSRLDLRGGGTKKAPKHYQNPSIKLRSRPKSAFHRSCTGKPRSFAPKTSTRHFGE